MENQDDLTILLENIKSNVPNFKDYLENKNIELEK